MCWKFETGTRQTQVKWWRGSGPDVGATRDHNPRGHGDEDGVPLQDICVSRERKG